MTVREGAGADSGATTPANTSTEDDGLAAASVTDAEAHLVQLRRRRAAAQRLAILDDEPADPLDAYGRVPSSHRSTLAARRAWWHLQDHGLLDGDGWLADVLAEGVAS